MKRYFRKKWVKVVAAVAMSLAGAWAAGAAWDTYGVMKMTWKMKTVCAGRMLIDLPEEAQLEFYGQWIHGFDIDAFAESTEAFDKRLAAREAELRAKPDYLGGNKNMESAREVKTDSGLSGKIFVHGRYVHETTAGYDRESFRHIRTEGIALEAHVHAGGISVDLTSKKYHPDLIENLPKLVAQLVPNSGNRIPTEAGFCLDQAWVRDPLTAKQGERITFAVKLPSHPDIGINFDSIAGTRPAADGLIARNAAARARLPAALNLLVTNLRAAPRTIGGLTGDELVQQVVEPVPAIVHGFQWEVRGAEDNVMAPALNLTMATGRGDEGPVWSSLSEPAAMVLWDKIVSSIRVRPATPTVPGALASAGDTCPHTGWWECAAAGKGVKVHGGRRRYIRQGERMPQALLLTPPTLWEKLKGLPPRHAAAAPTTWTMVEK